MAQSLLSLYISQAFSKAVNNCFMAFTLTFPLRILGWRSLLYENY
ncbi:hypothetical protein [Anabaena azotica]|nr:hypothetical protein [Anabaena azotica]